MTTPRLVVFDVDGTLVDSQGAIVAALTEAFAAIGDPPPARAEMLSIVGLSLDHAMARLAPHRDGKARAKMVAAYRESYFAQRTRDGTATSSPLYPGARAALEALAERPDTLLGIATGKSRRGLEALLDAHGLRRHFLTTQVADDHPSKPHPSMLWSALRDCGVEPDNAVMVGDTQFDIEMAHAAGICAVAVSWGYHARDKLGAADAIIDGFASLPATIATLWGSAS